MIQNFVTFFQTNLSNYLSKNDLALIANTDSISRDGSKDMSEYLSYLSSHGKQYRTEEEFSKRFQNFQHTLREIEQHDENETGYSIGLNDFADWDQDELESLNGW